MDYKSKYLKYKHKYTELKQIIEGGASKADKAYVTKINAIINSITISGEITDDYLDNYDIDLVKKSIGSSTKSNDYIKIHKIKCVHDKIITKYLKDIQKLKKDIETILNESYESYKLSNPKITLEKYQEYEYKNETSNYYIKSKELSNKQDKLDKLNEIKTFLDSRYLSAITYAKQPETKC